MERPGVRLAASRRGWRGRELDGDGGHSSRPTVSLMLGVVCVLLASPSGVSEALRSLSTSLVLAIVAVSIVALHQSRGVAIVPTALMPFLGWLSVGISYSVLPAESLRGVGVALCIVLLAAVISSKLSVDEIVQGLVWMGVVAVVGSLVLWAVSPERAMSAIGLQGIFGHKNILGFVLLVSVVAAMSRKWGDGRLRVIVVGLLFAGLIVSDSATSLLLAVGVVLGYWVISRMRGARGGPGERMLFFIVVFTAVGLSVAAVSQDVDAVLGVLGKTATLSARTTIWAAADTYISYRPLEGYGYSAVWTDGSPVGELIRASSTASATHAHNGYRDILLASGGVGLALYLLFLLSAARTAVTQFRIGSWPVGGFQLMLLITMLLSNMVELRFFNPLGWLLMTLILCMRVTDDGMFTPGNGDGSRRD